MLALDYNETLMYVCRPISFSQWRRFIHCSAISIIWPDRRIQAVLPYCHVYNTDVYFRRCLDFGKVEQAISKRRTSWSAGTN